MILLRLRMVMVAWGEMGAFIDKIDTAVLSSWHEGPRWNVPPVDVQLL